MKLIMTVLGLCFSLSSLSAMAATDLQIANAKKAAYEVVEKIALQREPIVLVGRTGWKLSSVDLRKANPTMDYQVTPIFLARRVTRISVRLYLNAFSPDGKIEWLTGGSYRVLVDLKDDGEVIGAEVNYFTNLMSYEDPSPVVPAKE